VAFFFLFFIHGTSIGNSQQGISYNALQISEGTNSVGIVRLDLGFCLCAVRCLVLNFFFFGGVRWVLQLTIII